MYQRHSLLSSLVALTLLLVGMWYTNIHNQNPTAVRNHEIVVPENSSSTPTIGGEWATVERVVDGDTVVLALRGAKTTVRLIGLNTPEVVDPKIAVQCFGPEASAQAHIILDGQKVRFETDASQGVYDKYGRTLGYIFLTDGTNFQEMMIEKGFGREYTYKKPYKYKKEFTAAEAAAQKARAGLWSLCKTI